MSAVGSDPAAAVTATRLGDVLVLVIDNPPVNVSSVAVRRGILAGIQELAGDDGLIGAVLIGKGNTFVAGSDVREFTGPVPEPLLPAVIDEIEACPKPVIAALDGYALGGGLELALGCDVRLATARCQLGLPEVTLGMVPGAGGTQRLPRLIGRCGAIDLIVTGRRIDGTTAHRLGLVDDVIPPADLRAAAVARARTAAKRPVSRRPVPEESAAALAAAVTQALRAGGARPQVRIAIDMVLSAGTAPLSVSLAQERAAFERLRAGAEAAALRYLFFAERAAGKAGTATGSNPRTVRRVAVVTVGTGDHAEGIGAVLVKALAASGYHTVPVKADVESTVRTTKRGAEVPSLRQVAPADIDLAACELVIEAVEDPAVAPGALAAVARTVPDAIVATTTCPSQVDRLATGVAHPSQVIGLHPIARGGQLRLVEVMPGSRTAGDTVATVVRVIRGLGVQPVVLAPTRGGMVERIVAAGRRQVEQLLAEGVEAAQVDAALTGFGFPPGALVTTRHPVPLPGTESSRSAGDPTRVIVERCVLAMVNEASVAVAEGVVARPSDTDVALVHGFGFPRHEGGPLWWASRQPRERVLSTLAVVSAAAGPAFRPGPVPQVLDQLVRTDSEPTRPGV